MFPLPVIAVRLLRLIRSHCDDSLVLVCPLRSMKVSMISRSGLFLVLLQRRNGLPIRFHRKRFAVLVIVIPSVQNVFVTIFVVTGFLQHFMCFVIHALPHTCAADQLLRLFAELIEFLSLVQILY